ncbi:Sensory/regulatory protein RpfC [Pseudoruegeria aquimaris]|uniref:histidine kinase n=1 Tax=Pseudoruegeria aquimaris TaxID=393663 RepID=A0A1Y5TKJ0_9RHOB|nr:ATP-binding protein [Pseudoruegeria aquimaris]SLN62579.1 Sensory/regulatory protein RpfC [Pseudoruegeria aquimaris]
MAQALPGAGRPAPSKYSREGRLQRFCRGRFSTLPVRAGFEVAGALIVAGFISPGWGVMAALALMGAEVVELCNVAHVQRSGLILRDAKAASHRLAAGSAIWAAGVCGAIGILWFVGGPELWVLCMAFLTAGLVNGQLVAGLHPESFRAKLAVLAAMVGIVIGDSLLTPEADLRTYLVYLTAAVLLFTMLAGLFDRLRQQNESRHEAERRLLEANAEIRETLQRLEASQAALVRRAEEARELQRRAEAASIAKSEFLAVMSHEIRTPLNAILGMAEVLRESALSPDQAEMLETIEGGGRALLSIINDVLDFSRIEAGKAELEQIPFALARPLQDCAALFSPLLDQKGLSFECDIAEAEGVWVVGDAGKLRQVVMNLLGNALKFTEAGRVSLAAKVAPGAGGADAGIEIEVADTGLGIPQEALQRIFEPFEQVDAKTTRLHGGTGLGLAISRKLARHMGGDLVAVSTPGEGSRFKLTLTLPRAAAAEAPAQASAQAPSQAPSQGPEQAAAAGQSELAGLLVLAAEDNRANRLVLARLLAGSGIDLTFAEDGVQAVEAAQASRFDLILMDMSMPRLDGIGATRRIRAAEAEQGMRATPIVALTANAFEKDRRACQAAGMDGFLSKPLRKAELLAEIRRVASSPAAVAPS